MKKNVFKRALSMAMAVLMVLSCWVWFEPAQVMADAAASTIKDHYLFAYFTGTSKEGQTIHLAVSEDGYNYTALRGNDPVIIPSKGVGCVRDPYIWYNEQDNYYYILATDLDFTDSGTNENPSTYSTNSQSFIIWRSKDLVNWYDETMIDVSKMSHLVGDTRNMSAVWAPQVLWDGSSYVVYFTLNCNATNSFELVYLKTTDLLDPDAYYDFGFILRNFLENRYGNDGLIDADIIHNPGDGKYYLFYKTENNSGTHGTTTSNSPLKTVHYRVGDTPIGPFNSNGDNKWPNCGFTVFPDYKVSLEGCNSFFDNDGNLIMYVDEFEHKNAADKAEAYFHIAKSNGYDFTSWSYPDVSQHNINSLSPRHGSVVKITEAEYNRLLDNSYAVSSSSFPASETLEDHLVARFFTTSDASYNAVVGAQNLDVVSGITMSQTTTGSWVADFNESYATIDLEKLFLSGLNYNDGFSITFKAKVPEGALDNVRFYEITDKPGTRTGVEHYTHLSPKAQGNGIYMGTYNGPEVARLEQNVDNNDWASDRFGINRDDNKWHEYLISYANGNYIVYVDGTVCIMKNRFNTTAMLDDSWYNAIGSSTLYIGRSGFRTEYGSQYNDADFTGQIRDFCIYDTSMSYYDLQAMDSKMKSELEYVNGINYTGVTSVVPTFQNTNADLMKSLPNKEQHFSNILYTSNTVKNYDGNNMSSDSAVYKKLGCGDLWVAMYYPKTTVMLLDGVNDAIMPISFGTYCENKNKQWKSFLRIYPTSGPGKTDDLGELEISQNWAGWYNDGSYYNCITKHEDGYIGRNSTTTSWSSITSKANYDCHWGAPLKVNGDKINFGDSYYKKFNLTWQVVGGDKDDWVEKADHSVNFTAYNNDIYVIDFRPILELRSQMTAAEYNRIMNGAYCQTLKEKYADAVFTIQTLDPRSYDFTKNAEVGTKALAKAIKDAMDNYNGVIKIIKEQDATGVYGHETEILPAREATCKYNGLTQGEICTLCGKVIVPQQTLSTVPHTFGDVYKKGEVQYKKCSVCGVEIEYQASGVRYENLFSFNAWAKSASNQIANGTGSGTVSADSLKGQITIKNTFNDEVYTRGHYTGKNLSTRDFGCYCIPVTGGKTYVVEATSLSSSTSWGEVFIFQFTKDGTSYEAIPTVLRVDPGKTAHNEFTVDKNAAFIELRFDCNEVGKTITFSDIGIYTKDSADKFANTTQDARLGFYPGYNEDLCYPNPGDGYSFAGWYTKSGIKIENVNQLNIPTTIVYGKWIDAGLDISYDNLFSFSSWAKSSCNRLYYRDDNSTGTLQRLVTTEGIVTDAENGTITITNDEDTNNFARTNYWVDNGNIYKSKLDQNTEYILEYTVTSEDGGKPSVCLYITGGTPQYPETGNATRYSTGTHYFRFDSGNNTELTLRFDNAQHGSTVTYSDIAVYKADFEEAARTITNREYRRYYPTKMGIGDVFEYTPTRPGFTFGTWMADTNADGVGDENWAGKDDTFIIEKNWHLFSTWTENSYTIKYDANNGSGSVANQSAKYTADVKLASSGFTKSGYVLAGWSTVANATTPLYQLGQTVNRLNGDANGTTTLYAVWKEKVKINVTFDNMFDFNSFTISSNLEVSKRTDTGFTATSKVGDGNTGFSKAIAVEPGKTYIFSADVAFDAVAGGGYDMYIHTLDANQAGETTAVPDTSNGAHREGNVYISLTGQTTNTKPYIRFTAGDNTRYITIRFDANNAGNKITVNNIRICEDKGISVSPVNKFVYTGDALGTVPYPTKAGYAFTGWYLGSKEYTANSVVNTDGTLYLTSEWLDMNKAYVLDFAVKATFNPLDNDEFNRYYSSYTITGVSNSMNAAASTTAAGKFGTFAINGNSITYTATSVMKSADVVYYHVDCNGYKFTSSVTVYPATVVYYEDDIGAVTYTGNWQVVKDETPFATVSGANAVADVYGYSAEYNNTSYFSMGEAHYVTVSAADSSAWPTATFTFAGTGFDIVSLVNSSTGFVKINVTGKSTGKVFNWVLDTNGSYVYENGKWVASDNAPDHYQIPVLSRDLGAYDTYTVVITPMYTKAFDHTHKGSYDFCLDAIRIYNPMGDDADAATVYAADGEYILSHEVIRDILVNLKDSNGDGTPDEYEKDENYVSDGVVYIAPGMTEGSFAEYAAAGPKNEVYLAEGQSIAFNLTVGGIKPTSVQISAHALDGTASMVFGSAKSNSDTVSISHKTSLYYNSPFVGDGYWEFDDENGCWTTTNPIVITNNGEGLLALCNIKVTTDGASAVPVSYRMTPADFAVAAATAENLAGLEPGAEALFVPDELTPETNTDVVEKGEEVLVTINTSAEVYALTVNGEYATLASTNDDGSKTWTYSFVTETRGEMTFNLVAYNSDGFASEETSVTVDVQSRIEIFFTKVTNFFKMIIEFLDNMFAN